MWMQPRVPAISIRSIRGSIPLHPMKVPILQQRLRSAISRHLRVWPLGSSHRPRRGPKSGRILHVVLVEAVGAAASWQRSLIEVNAGKGAGLSLIEDVDFLFTTPVIPPSLRTQSLL